MGDVAQLRGQEADVRLGAEEGGDTRGGGCGGGGRRASREKRPGLRLHLRLELRGGSRGSGRATRRRVAAGRQGGTTRRGARPMERPRAPRATVSPSQMAWRSWRRRVPPRASRGGALWQRIRPPRRKLTNDGIEAARETFDFVNGCDSQIFQQSIFKIMKLVPHTFDRKGVLHQS